MYWLLAYPEIRIKHFYRVTDTETAAGVEPLPLPFSLRVVYGEDSQRYSHRGACSAGPGDRSCM